MMTTEGGPTGLDLAPDARVGIIAGGGSLPVEVAAGLWQRKGYPPFIVLIEGEADRLAELARYDHETLALEAIGSLVPLLRRHRDHAIWCLPVRSSAGRGLRRSAPKFRPAERSYRCCRHGADARRRRPVEGVARGIEARGIKVIGAHQVVPELVAAEGLLTRQRRRKSDWRDIEAARIAAAKAIGALDIGQAAVAIGGRAIALEGIEGTDGLLERVRDTARPWPHRRPQDARRAGQMRQARPGTTRRPAVDRPAHDRVEAAHAAGLAGIAVEAGRSLVLDGPEPWSPAPTRSVCSCVGLPPRARAMADKRALKIAIVAGEESGDLLGADLVRGASAG